MSSLERLKASFADVVRWVMRDFPYAKRYPVTIVRQESNGTVDVLADDQEMRGQGQQNVRLRLGIPGLSAELNGNAKRALLAFEDADPARPYVAEWEAAGACRLGTLGVALFANPPPGTGTSVTAVQFFPATTAGDVALAAFQLANPLNFTTDIETSNVRIQ